MPSLRISVYRDKNDLLKMQSRVPAKKGSHIAKGNLNPDIGQILPTHTKETPITLGGSLLVFKQTIIFRLQI